MSNDHSTQTASPVYPCPIQDKKGIAEEKCTAIGRSYGRNLQGCCGNRCRSPWRVCPKCALQMAWQNLLGPKDSIQMVHPAENASPAEKNNCLDKGYCNFHLVEGKEADRRDKKYQGQLSHRLADLVGRNGRSGGSAQNADSPKSNSDNGDGVKSAPTSVARAGAPLRVARPSEDLPRQRPGLGPANPVPVRQPPPVVSQRPVATRPVATQMLPTRPVSAAPVAPVMPTSHKTEVSQAEEDGYLYRADNARVKAMPRQPRSYFDEEELAELEASLRANGQLEPCKAIKIEGDPNYDYQLINGGRRKLMITKIGIPTILLRVIGCSDPGTAFEKALAANLNQAKLTPYEMAMAMVRLRDEYGRTDEQIAVKSGKTLTYVQNMLRIPELHPEVQKMLEPRPLPQGKKAPRGWSTQLNMWTAWNLLSLPQEEQLEHARTIVARGMTVGRAATYLREVKGKSAHRPSEDYARLMKTLDVANAGVVDAMNLNDERFGAMFARRHDDLVLGFFRDVERLEKDLAKLRARVVESKPTLKDKLSK